MAPWSSTWPKPSAVRWCYLQHRGVAGLMHHFRLRSTNTFIVAATVKILSCLWSIMWFWSKLSSAFSSSANNYRLDLSYFKIAVHHQYQTCGELLLHCRSINNRSTCRDLSFQGNQATCSEKISCCNIFHVSFLQRHFQIRSAAASPSCRIPREDVMDGFCVNFILKD